MAIIALHDIEKLEEKMDKIHQNSEEKCICYCSIYLKDRRDSCGSKLTTRSSSKGDSIELN